MTSPNQVRASTVFAGSVLGLFVAITSLLMMSLAGCSVLEEAGFGEEPATPARSRALAHRNTPAVDPKGSAARAADPAPLPSAPAAPEPAVIGGSAPAPIAAGLAAASASAALASISEEPEIRVRIMAAGNRITIGVQRGGAVSRAGSLRVRAVAGTGAQGPVPGLGGSERRLRAPISIGLANGDWTVSDAADQKVVLGGGDMLIAPWESEGAANLLVGDAEYPGQIRLSARSDVSATAFDAIETVSLEAYLPGVVEKEMYRGWAAAAYEIQAVCARSYALHEHARSTAAGKRFDVEASTRDQAYDGVGAHADAVRAVESTRGLVLASDGKVLRTYYSSTCGGRAASARETWPVTPGFEYNAAPPLQARPRDSACDESPKYRWTVRRDRDELGARLREYGERQGMIVRNLADLASVTVDALSANGRPLRYRLTQRDGKWYTLRAEDMRLACNQSTPGQPALSRSDRVASSDLELQIDGDVVTIEGRGFGHGVGMCQFCAQGFASTGKSWREMATMFYPGAEIVRAYR